MRRVISFLLLIILAVANGIPCCDASPASSSSDVQVVMSAVKDCAPGDHCTDDACSPLCSCSCCAGAAAIPAALQVAFRAPFPFFSNAVSLRNTSGALRGAAVPVWQPPRLS